MERYRKLHNNNSVNAIKGKVISVIGCLCIHGFTGAPYEIEPLVNFLEEHTDWKISAPTLPGHGEEEDLSTVSYQQWIEFVEGELEKLIEECEVTYIIGFSMGGMLAAHLAAKYHVEKLVLLSAAAYYVNIKQLYLDVQEMVKDSLKGRLKSNVLFQRYKKKITVTPMSATKQFRLLIKMIKSSLKNVHVPTFPRTANSLKSWINFITSPPFPFKDMSGTKTVMTAWVFFS